MGFTLCSSDQLLNMSWTESSTFENEMAGNIMVSGSDCGTVVMFLFIHHSCSVRHSTLGAPWECRDGRAISTLGISVQMEVQAQKASGNQKAGWWWPLGLLP